MKYSTMMPYAGTRLARATISALMSCSLLFIGAAQAANITWTDGSTFNGIDGHNSISLEGFPVRAVNLGGNAGNLDVVVDNGTKTETLTFVDDNDLFPNSAFNVVSPASGSDNWNSIITRADYASNTTPYPFSLSDLIVGQEYQVEFFVADARSSSISKTFYFDDGNGNASATHTHGDWISVIGNFIADGTSQTIRLTQQGGDDPTMNAYVLRSIDAVPAQLHLTPSDQLTMDLYDPATVANGSVDAAFVYGANSNNVQITSATVVDQQHTNAFSVVGFTSPLELTDPASPETLNIQFDVTGTGMAIGETSTGIVEIVWNEIGGESNTNTLPVSVLFGGEYVTWTDGLSFVGGNNQNNISLAGFPVKAVNLGGNAGNLDVVVNDGIKTETLTFVDDNALFGNSAFNVPTPGTGDADWNSIMIRADYSKNASPYSFDITDLIIGQDYQIEFFVWDSRYSNRTFYLDDGKGNVSAVHNESDGVSVIGTFTAAAETQTFTITQSAGSPVMNAYVVRTFGEIDAQLSLTPDELDMTVTPPATSTTGALNLSFAYGSGYNNVVITSASVIDQQHPGAFSVINFTTPLELTDPSANETLTIEFDATAGGVPAGETSTGLVQVVWNEVGGAAKTNTVSISGILLGGYATATVEKDTDPTEAAVLNANVVAAVNWGTTWGEGIGIATQAVVNGTAFTTISSISHTSGVTSVNETYGYEGRAQLNVTASAVQGYSSFDGSWNSTGNIETIFSSVGVVSAGDLNFAFTDLQEGATYQLQLLFSSGTQARALEIRQNGNPDAIATWDNGTESEAVITLTWVANASGTEAFSFVPTINTEILSGFVFASSEGPPAPALQMNVGNSGILNVLATELIAGYTYTLQGADSLMAPSWEDIATTSGVSEVEWEYTPTKPVEFLRVIAP